MLERAGTPYCHRSVCCEAWSGQKSPSVLTVRFAQLQKELRKNVA